MNKEDLQVKDLFTGSVIERVDKIIKYIKQNVGVFSVLFTVLIAIGGTFIKLVYYLNELGYTHYFGVSRELIDVSRGNILYSFFSDAIVALFVILINYILYERWKNSGIAKRIGHLFGVFLVFPLIILVFKLLYYKSHGVECNFNDGLVLMITNIIVCGLLFFLSFSLIFMNFMIKIIDKSNVKRKIKRRRKNLKNKNFKQLKFKKTNINKFKVKKDKSDNQKQKLLKELKKRLTIIVIWFLLEAFIIILIGYQNAKILNKFKVLENLSNNHNYAVVYETSDSFIITQCEINYTDETISFVDLATKKEIDKKGVEYSVRKLKQEKD